MFALIDLESANKICLKCDPEYALELREHYVAIEGAYHFNKKYWNQVFLDGDVDDKLLKQLIDHSVEEVLKKFTKKMRTEYEAPALTHSRSRWWHWTRRHRPTNTSASFATSCKNPLPN